VTPLYPQKLALTLPTGGGRSVGIVRSRTKATELIVTLKVFLCCGPTLATASSFTSFFLDHTQRRRTTDVRPPLDEWSPCRSDLYPTTHNTHNKQTSMPLAGFEPTISAGEWRRTCALDLAAAGIGLKG